MTRVRMPLRSARLGAVSVSRYALTVHPATHNATHNRSDLQVLTGNYEVVRDLQVVVEAEDSGALKRTRFSDSRPAFCAG